MAKALIIFGSTTGNTESTAQTIAGILNQNDIDTVVKDVTAADLDDFSGGYDVTLLGCSTWGDDEIELQEDFADFYDNMDGLDLKGQKLAVFGCGDSSYTHFCGAVDALEEKTESLGAKLVAAGLKIDGDPDDAYDAIVDWANRVVSRV